MRERFTHWVLLTLALALTMLGRPDRSFDRAQGDEEALRGGHDDPSLMSEERRTPGVRRSADAERQTKPSAAGGIATWMVQYEDLVILASVTPIAWMDGSSCRHAAHACTISARGPPVIVA